MASPSLLHLISVILLVSSTSLFVLEIPITAFRKGGLKQNVILPHQYALELFILQRVDLLMRDVRRHEYEVTRSSFCCEF